MIPTATWSTKTINMSIVNTIYFTDIIKFFEYNNNVIKFVDFGACSFYNGDSVDTFDYFFNLVENWIKSIEYMSNNKKSNTHVKDSYNITLAELTLLVIGEPIESYWRFYQLDPIWKSLLTKCVPQLHGPPAQQYNYELPITDTITLCLQNFERLDIIINDSAAEIYCLFIYCFVHVYSNHNSNMFAILKYNCPNLFDCVFKVDTDYYSDKIELLIEQLRHIYFDDCKNFKKVFPHIPKIGAYPLVAKSLGIFKQTQNLKTLITQVMTITADTIVFRNYCLFCHDKIYFFCKSNIHNNDVNVTGAVIFGRMVIMDLHNENNTSIYYSIQCSDVVNSTIVSSTTIDINFVYRIAGNVYTQHISDMSIIRVCNFVHTTPVMAATNSQRPILRSNMFNSIKICTVIITAVELCIVFNPVTTSAKSFVITPVNYKSTILTGLPDTCFRFSRVTTTAGHMEKYIYYCTLLAYMNVVIESTQSLDNDIDYLTSPEKNNETKIINVVGRQSLRDNIDTIHAFHLDHISFNFVHVDIHAGSNNINVYDIIFTKSIIIELNATIIVTHSNKDLYSIELVPTNMPKTFICRNNQVHYIKSFYSIIPKNGHFVCIIKFKCIGINGCGREDQLKFIIQK